MQRSSIPLAAATLMLCACATPSYGDEPALETTEVRPRPAPPPPPLPATGAGVAQAPAPSPEAPWVIPIALPAVRWSGACSAAPTYPVHPPSTVPSSCEGTFDDDALAHAVHIHSNAPFDFASHVPRDGSFGIDLRPSDHAALRFSVAAKNANTLGWQGNFPVIIIGGGGRQARYEPETNLLPTAVEKWVPISVPLTGGNGFRRVSGDVPTRIDYIELHTDTFGVEATDLWISELRVQQEP